MIRCFNLLLQFDKFLVQAGRESPSETAQPVRCIFQKLRQASPQLRYILRQDDSILRQQTEDLIDQLRPAIDQATAYPVQTVMLHRKRVGLAVLMGV